MVNELNENSTQVRIGKFATCFASFGEAAAYAAGALRIIDIHSIPEGDAPREILLSKQNGAGLPHDEYYIRMVTFDEYAKKGHLE